MKQFSDYLTDPNWEPVSPEDGAKVLRIGNGQVPLHPRILTDADGVIKEARGYMRIACGMYRPTTTKFNKRSWRTTYAPAIHPDRVPA